MGWGKKGEISLLNVALVVKVETSLYDRGFMTLPPWVHLWYYTKNVTKVSVQLIASFTVQLDFSLSNGIFQRFLNIISSFSDKFLQKHCISRLRLDLQTPFARICLENSQLHSENIGKHHFQGRKVKSHFNKHFIFRAIFKYVPYACH